MNSVYFAVRINWKQSCTFLCGFLQHRIAHVHCSFFNI